MPIGAARAANVCPVRHAARIIYSTPAIKKYSSDVKIDTSIKTHGKHVLN
jgi:hypothetical protein